MMSVSVETVGRLIRFAAHFPSIPLMLQRLIGIVLHYLYENFVLSMIFQMLTAAIDALWYTNKRKSSSKISQSTWKSMYNSQTSIRYLVKSKQTSFNIFNTSLYLILFLMQFFKTRIADRLFVHSLIIRGERTIWNLSCFLLLAYCEPKRFYISGRLNSAFTKDRWCIRRCTYILRQRFITF